MAARQEHSIADGLEAGMDEQVHILSKLTYIFGRALENETARRRSELSCAIYRFGRQLYQTYAIESDTEKYDLLPNRAAKGNSDTSSRPTAQPLLDRRINDRVACGQQSDISPPAHTRRNSEPCTFTSGDQTVSAFPRPTFAGPLPCPPDYSTPVLPLPRIPPAEDSQSSNNLAGAQKSHRMQAAKAPQVLAPSKRPVQAADATEERRGGAGERSEHSEDEMPNVLPPTAKKAKPAEGGDPKSLVVPIMPTEKKKTPRAPRTAMKAVPMQLSPSSSAIDRHALLADLKNTGLLKDTLVVGFVNWICCDLLGPTSVMRLKDMIDDHQHKFAEESAPITIDEVENAPEPWKDALSRYESVLKHEGMRNGKQQFQNYSEFALLGQAAQATARLYKLGSAKDSELLDYLNDELGVQDDNASATDPDKRGPYIKGLITTLLCKQLGKSVNAYYRFVNKAKISRILLRRYSIGIASIFHPMSRLSAFVGGRSSNEEVESTQCARLLDIIDRHIPDLRNYCQGTGKEIMEVILMTRPGIVSTDADYLLDFKVNPPEAESLADGRSGDDLAALTATEKNDLDSTTSKEARAMIGGMIANGEDAGKPRRNPTRAGKAPDSLRNKLALMAKTPSSRGIEKSRQTMPEPSQRRERSASLDKKRVVPEKGHISSVPVPQGYFSPVPVHHTPASQDSTGRPSNFGEQHSKPRVRTALTMPQSSQVARDKQTQSPRPARPMLPSTTPPIPAASLGQSSTNSMSVSHPASSRKHTITQNDQDESDSDLEIEGSQIPQLQSSTTASNPKLPLNKEELAPSGYPAKRQRLGPLKSKMPAGSQCPSQRSSPDLEAEQNVVNLDKELDQQPCSNAGVDPRSPHLPTSTSDRQRSASSRAPLCALLESPAGGPSTETPSEIPVGGLPTEAHSESPNGDPRVEPPSESSERGPPIEVSPSGNLYNVTYSPTHQTPTRSQLGRSQYKNATQETGATPPSGQPLPSQTQESSANLEVDSFSPDRPLSQRLRCRTTQRTPTRSRLGRSQYKNATQETATTPPSGQPLPSQTQGSLANSDVDSSSPDGPVSQRSALHRNPEYTSTAHSTATPMSGQQLRTTSLPAPSSFEASSPVARPLRESPSPSQRLAKKIRSEDISS